jgi:LPXTG-site transpeptidase (sortase) family protein
MSSPKNRKIFLLFSTMLGLLLIVVGEVTLYYQRRILSFTSNPYAKIQSVARPELLPKKITIPDLKIDLPIEEGVIAGGIWEISPKNATHLDTSSSPTLSGNIVIYGHNKRVIFGSLAFAKKGMLIDLLLANGQRREYKIVDVLQVDPSDVAVVAPTTTQEILTVYTCTGFLDSKRLVVKALPIL